MTWEKTIPRELQMVNFGHKLLSDYRTMLVPGMYEEIEELSNRLKGARVLHVSATSFGGGVAEIMYTLMPLMADAGLNPGWGIIHGAEEFFEVTKLLHNTLQGADDDLTQDMKDVWWKYQEINAAMINPDDWDVIFIHDPQPLGVKAFHEGGNAKWAWRCHIDLSTPNKNVIDFLLPELNRYPAAFFHCDEYVPAGLEAKPWIVPPAIDPLAPKNMALSDHDAKYIVEQFGIDGNRPLMCQVSRFDPWKDPIGVIDAYKQVKKTHPDLQLAMIGSMAHDDPEGWDYFNKTVEHAQGDNDVFVLSNFNNVGAVEVNAFQVHSAALLQKSIREGFGLTVSEALWKARPMVAGNVGGIKKQIIHGETGWLVDSVESAAQATEEILADPVRAAGIAQHGKEFVREHFLMPRYLRDHLRLYCDLLGV